MVIDTYIQLSEGILEEIWDEAVDEVGESGPTRSAIAADYGAFEVLCADVKEVTWNNLASSIRPLMSISELDLAGLWEAKSVMRMAKKGKRTDEGDSTLWPLMTNGFVWPGCCH